MKESDTPVLCDLLQKLNSEGKITAAALADLLNLSTSGAYPYLSHRDASYSQVRTLMRRSGNPALQATILDDLTRNTGWLVTQVDPEMDVDGDGDVDLEDALKKCAESIQAASAFVYDGLCTEKRKKLTPDDMDKYLGLSQELLDAAVKVRRITEFYAEEIDRKNARQANLKVGGGR